LYKFRPQNEQTVGCNFSVASARNTFVEPVFNNVCGKSNRFACVLLNVFHYAPYVLFTHFVWIVSSSLRSNFPIRNYAVTFCPTSRAWSVLLRSV